MKRANWRPGLLLALTVLIIGCCLTACGQPQLGAAFSPFDSPQAANEQEQITILLVHSANEGGFTDDCVRFLAERLRQDSAGRINMKIYSNDQIGNIYGGISLLAEGVIQMRVGFGAADYYIMPMSLPALTGLDLKQTMAALDEGEPLRQIVDEYSEEKGSMLLGFMPGQYHVLSANRQIADFSDVAGLRLRHGGSGNKRIIWSTLGAEPVAYALNEVHTAIREEAIDGICSNTLVNIAAYGYYWPGGSVALTRQSIEVEAIYINKEFFDSLSAADQNLLRRDVGEMLVMAQQELADSEEKALAQLDAAQVTVVDFTPAQTQPAYALTRQLLYDFYRDLLGQSVLDALLAAAGN